MADVETGRLVVVDTRQVKHLATAPQLHVFVAQDPHAELPQVLAPSTRIRVVLVIARDEAGPMGGGEARERRDVPTRGTSTTTSDISNSVDTPIQT